MTATERCQMRDADIAAHLTAAGLSEHGTLGSVGIAGHLAHLRAGAVSAKRLVAYARDLTCIARHTLPAGIPVDAWDVPPDQHSGTSDVYAVAQVLAQPEHLAYLGYLAQAFRRFARFQRGDGTTAVMTVLDLLLVAARAVQAGVALPPLAPVRERTRDQQALFLWQQIAVGSTRWAPIIHYPLVPHTAFSRCNVATLWQYAQGRAQSLSALWGVSGFHAGYIGDPHNDNQIEHLTITAVMQGVFGVGLGILNALEWGERLSPHVPAAEMHADIALNRAVASVLLPAFTSHAPERAVLRMRAALAQPPTARRVATWHPLVSGRTRARRA
jgi:hypothetical protein